MVIPERVKAFYEVTPFNHCDTAFEQAAVVSSARIDEHYPVLQGHLREGMTHLEVGCGSGWFTNGLALHHKVHCTGIDFNPVAIERARETWVYVRNGRAPIYEVANLFDYEPSEKFEFVTSLGVLHHTEDCKGGLRRICDKFLLPGGTIFIGLYHKYSREPFLQEFRSMEKRGVTKDEMFDRYCSLRGVSKTTRMYGWFLDQIFHPHEEHFTMSEMTELLAECGMTPTYCSIPGDEREYESASGFFTFMARKDNANL